MGRSIAVVEDDSTFRRLIVRELKARGHAVRAVGTASEAGETLLGQPPDLLILDINLPDSSGWYVLRKLQEHGIEPPTIVISALRIGPSLLEEFPPMAYLPKPFALGALLALVRGDGWPVVMRAAASRPQQRA